MVGVQFRSLVSEKHSLHIHTWRIDSRSPGSVNKPVISEKPEFKWMSRAICMGSSWIIMNENMQQSRDFSEEKAKDFREVGNKDRKGKDPHETESVKNLQRCSAGCCILMTQKKVPTHYHSTMPFCHA